MTQEQDQGYEAATVRCNHCNADVHYLEVFPAHRDGTGSACLPCYVKHVDAKRTDAERFSALMGAFGK
jgi:hypothetical protein